MYVDEFLIKAKFMYVKPQMFSNLLHLQIGCPIFNGFGLNEHSILDLQDLQDSQFTHSKVKTKIQIHSVPVSNRLALGTLKKILVGLRPKCVV